MKNPRMPISDEFSNPKPRIKKTPIQKTRIYQPKGVQEVQGSLPRKTAQKASQRISRTEISPVFHQPERSNSDSLPDSSTSGNGYRALRRKYLLLEEDSFALGKELKDVEDEVNALEDEKLALLDRLVVLEGLVDHSELHSQGKL